jgi:hypothetical protein
MATPETLSMKTAIFIGVVVGVTWFLAKIIGFFGLPATASAIIIGAFAGMGYSIAYTVYEAFLKDGHELKQELKKIERQMRRDMQEVQRQQQMEAMRQRMAVQMQSQGVPQQTIYTPGVPVKQPVDSTTPPPQAAPPGPIQSVPIPGDPDYTMSPYG